MSILQEYATIRRAIGEKTFSHIEMFLDCHPQYLLSDVYYKESVWNEFESWETAEGLNKNYKYENVDVIAFLEEKMKSNTESYQTDFEYDKEVIYREVGRIKGPENLLWLSRRNGTHCMLERDVFINGTPANTTWKHFEGYEPNEFLAFAVEITGVENDVIKGNCYELDYMAHIQDVKAKAVKAKDELLIFEDCHEELVSFPNNYYRTSALVKKHGPINHVRYIPKNSTDLYFVLKEQQDKRKAMKPFKKQSLDTRINNAENKKNNQLNKELREPDKTQQR